MAGRPRTFLGTLTAEEKKELEEISRSRTEQLRRIQRAKTILLAYNGATNEEIMKAVGVARATVNNTLRKWKTLGVEAALQDLKRPGQPRRIHLDAKAWVISLAMKLPEELNGAPRTQFWTIPSLTKYVHENCRKAGYNELETVSGTMVWKILNDRDIKPQNCRYYLEKKDPDFEEKAKKVLLLYKRIEWILQMTQSEVANGARADELCGEVFVSYDEKPGIQAIRNVSPDLPPDKTHGYMRRDYEYKRMGTVSFLAAIDLLNGEVTGIVRQTHNSTDFIDLLKLLDEKYNPSCKINIILDNHSVHRSKTVVEFLASKPDRFAFTFTPKHSSWLNLVESFFSKLAKQALRGLRVKSLDDLKERIMDWVDITNKEKVVYRWQWQLEDIENAFTGRI